MNRACADYRQQLILFHYRELDLSEMQEIAAHLADCQACRQELRQIQELLSTVPRSELSLSPAQRQRFSERVMRARRGGRLPKWTWGGALAGIAMLAYLLILPAPTPPPAPPALVDLEILEQLELLQELELLQDLELLQQLEEAG